MGSKENIPRFFIRLVSGVALWGLLLGIPLSLKAHQVEESAGAARLVNVAGEVSLTSAQQPEKPLQVTANAPLFEGEVLVTERRSAVQASLEDGTMIYLGERARLSPGLLPQPGQTRSPGQLRLWQGSLLVEREELDRKWGRLIIDTPSGQAVIQGAGLYYLQVDAEETMLGVIKGYAELVGSKGAVRLGPGRSALLEFGYKPISLGDFRSRMVEARLWDMREAYWAESGLAGDEPDPRLSRQWDSRFTVSWAFGSGWRDLRRHGRFRWSIRYGWVWVPYHRTGWSPYTNGYWSWWDQGWYWVGSEPWGWVPYRYGSWVWDPHWGWIWCPGYSYAPSWVVWTYSPNGWGWCPRNPEGGQSSTPVGYVQPVDQDPVVIQDDPVPPKLPAPPPGRIIRPGKLPPVKPFPVKIGGTGGGDQPILKSGPDPELRPVGPGQDPLQGSNPVSGNIPTPAAPAPAPSPNPVPPAPAPSPAPYEPVPAPKPRPPQPDPVKPVEVKPPQPANPYVPSPPPKIEPAKPAPVKPVVQPVPKPEPKPAPKVVPVKEKTPPPKAEKRPAKPVKEPAKEKETE